MEGVYKFLRYERWTTLNEMKCSKENDSGCDMFAHRNHNRSALSELDQSSVRLPTKGMKS